MQPEIVPVILAGGEGRRLRPLTAPTRPKPFLKIFSDKSLLQMTLRRAAPFMPPVIVCDEQFAAAADREAEEIGIREVSIIAEPRQRGTGAAIACAAFLLQQQDPVLLVMPSDHVITNQKIFEDTVNRAAALAAEQEMPVVLGKAPEGAGSRFGYIHTRPVDGEIFQLASFTEKPPARAARIMAKSPGVFWNTGIFLCRAHVLLKLFAMHAPEIFEGTGHAMAKAQPGANMLRPDPRRYGAIPALSIDHAVMEKLQSGLVLPLETGWHDVGCWERVLALKLGSWTRSLDFSRRHERGQQQ